MNGTPVRRSSIVDRRTLLAAGLGGLLAAGCAPDAPPAPPVRAVDELVAERPFYIAFRGGARDWPELSTYAFEQAALLPELKAVEVPVVRTADGVLVCSFDTDTLRLTGVKHSFLDTEWAVLEQLRVTAAETSDPRQPAQPLARLDVVLERFLDRFVFFVEPQVKEAAGILMATLIAAGRPDRIVWKQPVTSARFAEARSHGFETWGYVLDEQAHLGANLKRYAASADISMLGVSARRPDRLVQRVVTAARGSGKPAIAYNVHGAEELRRVWDLGCTGIASTSIRRLLEVPAPGR